jgi:ABC-type xylose transport system permease subunit
MVTPLEPDSQIASLNFLPEMVSNRDRVLPTDLMLLGLVVVMGIGVRGIANHLSTRLHKQPSATPMLRNCLIIASILFLIVHFSRQAFLWEGINIYMTWLLQLFFSFSFGKI